MIEEGKTVSSYAVDAFVVSSVLLSIPGLPSVPDTQENSFLTKIFYYLNVVSLAKFVSHAHSRPVALLAENVILLDWVFIKK